MCLSYIADVDVESFQNNTGKELIAYKWLLDRDGELFLPFPLARNVPFKEDYVGIKGHYQFYTHFFNNHNDAISYLESDNKWNICDVSSLTPNEVTLRLCVFRPKGHIVVGQYSDFESSSILMFGCTEFSNFHALSTIFKYGNGLKALLDNENRDINDPW